MKTFIKILSRKIGDYETAEIKIKNPNNIIPREGERITVNKLSYDVKNVLYDFDKKQVLILVL